MYLENIVIDAVDPSRVGRFWQDLLGSRQLTDAAEGFETRLEIEGGPVLDLCFPTVPAVPEGSARLHLDLRGGAAQGQVVSRARSLGAEPLDIGQGDVPWVVMGDVAGNAFCVMEERDCYNASGPIAAIPIDSTDPESDARFWSWLTGWIPVQGSAPATLRHPSLRGPLLEFCHEPEAKMAEKNPMHLDVRLEPGDDPDRVAEGITARGGTQWHPDWGELQWRIFRDPSGNEFCVLPSRG